MRGLARWNNTARAMQQLGDGLIGAITDIAFLGDYLYMIGSMSRGACCSARLWCAREF